jgi:hypothetical protein
MIKISIQAMIPNHIGLYPMRTCKKELYDLGIEIVDDKPDILLIHTYRMEKEHVQSIITKKIPSILLERVASPHIISRTEIKNPAVIGVAKEATFRDWKLNNSIFYQGRYHCYLMAKYFGLDKEHPENCKKHPIEITEEDSKKIELWYNFIPYKMMESFINHPINFSDYRKTDINFYGTTQYGDGSSMVTLHRKTCLKKIKELKNCVCDISGRMNRNKYVNALTNTRVGISPWGLGEKCYRDFEVIFSGSILVKPNTHWVLDWTDSYNITNKYFIECAIDYSDLQSKVEWIRDNWANLKERREYVRNHCLHYRDPKIIAKHISEVINRCIKRIK